MAKTVQIDEKKAKYFDGKTLELLELITEKDVVINKEKKEFNGSLGEIEIVDLSDKIIGPFLWGDRNVNNEKIDQWEKREGSQIGFDKKHYKSYKDFLDNLYKDTQINSLVSYKFIDEHTFSWLIKTYLNKKIDQSFYPYIVDLINNAISEWDIRFLMLYLYIEKPFYIGSVEFNLFKKNDYGLNSEQSESIKEYAGRVYAKCIVQAEREKAIEIGREVCCLSIDILKICSIAMTFPQKEINFDLDTRANVVLESDVFTAPTGGKEVMFTKQSNVVPYFINDIEWERINRNNVAIYHDFLLKVSNRNKSELDHLLINAIQRFGNAFSAKNKHQRVVELFTVMESLLLPSTRSPILDSITKYCSKIISQDPNERIIIISLIKNMYKVRSLLIHHAKESDLSMGDLKHLQGIVNALICELIKDTDKYKTKKEILDKIDEAINEATNKAYQHRANNTPSR